RFGVRESILGRVQRRGATAEIISRPGWGPEVRLRVPRAVSTDVPTDPGPARTAPSEETP
ncbi:MAG: histidine kinase, partial [Cellulosimicrobium funkei]